MRQRHPSTIRTAQTWPHRVWRGDALWVGNTRSPIGLLARVEPLVRPRLHLLLLESRARLQQNSNPQIPPGLTNVNKDPERHQRECSVNRLARRRKGAGLICISHRDWLPDSTPLRHWPAAPSLQDPFSPLPAPLGACTREATRHVPAGRLSGVCLNLIKLEMEFLTSVCKFTRNPPCWKMGCILCVRLLILRLRPRAARLSPKRYFTDKGCESLFFCSLSADSSPRTGDQQCGVQEECITQKAACSGQKGDSVFSCSLSRLHVFNAAVFPPKWIVLHVSSTMEYYKR
uniref:uncharacterized protein LOC120811984 n=1 Tax=Gasterosteus aculeatus aculeatus TaxID=481459 RepID=UPI001A994D83|nr:uncharacterized protein LOC120811984 [Gasterosteus aculeatus aculeatus]